MDRARVARTLAAVAYPLRVVVGQVGAGASQLLDLEMSDIGEASFGTAMSSLIGAGTGLMLQLQAKWFLDGSWLAELP